MVIAFRRRCLPLLLLGSLACNSGAAKAKPNPLDAAGFGAPATGGHFGTGGTAATGGASASGSGGSSGTGGALGSDGGGEAGPISDAAYPTVDGWQGLSVVDPAYVDQHFIELLVGTWMIGWYGGQDHFSWIRIAPPASAKIGGTTSVQGEPFLPKTGVPYWTCVGGGAWTLTERPATVDLNPMPSGCAREIMTFDFFRPLAAQGKAILEVRISSSRLGADGSAETQSLSGLKFPDDYCNADLTSCPPPM